MEKPIKKRMKRYLQQNESKAKKQTRDERGKFDSTSQRQKMTKSFA
jgi:hypothetical protein